MVSKKMWRQETLDVPIETLGFLHILMSRLTLIVENQPLEFGLYTEVQ